MPDPSSIWLDQLYDWIPAIEPRGHRRDRLMAAPFPDPWRAILDRRVPFWRRWPAALQAEAEPLVHTFAAEQSFVGARDFVITDEVRVVIAACAVRPVLRLDLSLYDGVTEIVVYGFDRLTVPGHGGDVLGVAHHHGVVVLSWPAVLRGLERPDDGHDTALHEFVHAIDLADGQMDGKPPLRRRGDINLWLDTLGSRFAAQVAGAPTPLDPYAGTSMPEFFAVASEHFFERPDGLRRRLPDLFAQLERFYGWDPSEQ
jgi:Mlc titration factor MtfA (ptsG expression regulator)